MSQWSGFAVMKNCETAREDVKTETDESTAFGAVTKQRLVKKQDP
jgi:hypothetical protein